MCPLIHFFAPYGAKYPDCDANTNYHPQVEGLIKLVLERI